MDTRSIYSLGTFIMKGVEIVCGFWWQNHHHLLLYLLLLLILLLW